MAAALDVRIATHPPSRAPGHQAWVTPLVSTTAAPGLRSTSAAHVGHTAAAPRVSPTSSPVQATRSLALMAQPRTHLPHRTNVPLQIQLGGDGPSAVAVRSVVRRPASPPVSSPSLSNRSVSASSTLQLVQEVSSREADLQDLRAEVAAKEEEAANLHNRLRDVHFKLQEAAGTLDTLSVKVETVAGNRQSVLRASAQHIDAHVDTLQRWLAKMEWQLVEKDEEIASLHRVTERDRKTMLHQQDELGSFICLEEDNEAKAAQLQEDALQVRRHQAIGSWCSQVKAHIHRENADIALQREQRMVKQHLFETCEMNRWLHSLVMRFEDRCRSLRRALEGEGQLRNTLLMEERLSDTAAVQNQNKGDQLAQDVKAEFQALAEQLREENQRRASAVHLAHAYDQQEIAMRHHQTELMALTSCLREVTRALRDQSSTASEDLVEAQIRAAVESVEDYGATVPPLLHVSPHEYLIGSELVRCITAAGKVFVQAPGILPGDRGALVPIRDYLRSRAHHPPLIFPRQAGVASAPQVKSTPSGLPQLAPPLFGPSPTQVAQAAGLPAFMTPLAIGGAESLLKI